MAVHRLPGSPSHREVLEMSPSSKPKWYFTKEEIEEHSPSRKDGIDREYESHLRKLYCSHLQEVGMELKVPQVTIATAMMLCHRFYMCQSHAKNHWQVVANASMFLACKAEDTPRGLKDLIVVSFKLMYSWDPLAPQKIKRKEVYDKHKELILVGEQMILVNVAFDLNIEHPYKSLVAALKRLEISEKEVFKVAWNFVNDWLRTTLCLQYKPHYIAAGSIFLAAKLNKIKLPSLNGKAWWMQFDVSPKQLEEVTQDMLWLLGQSTITKQAASASGKAHNTLKPMAGKKRTDSMETTTRTISKAPDQKQPNDDATDPAASASGKAHNTLNPMAGKKRPDSIETTTSIISKAPDQKQPNDDAIDPVRLAANCLSDSSSANSVVEDCDPGHVMRDSGRKPGCQIVSVKRSCVEMDIARIREKLKIRKLEKVGYKNLGGSLGNEMSGEDWIEQEIEKGIELVSATS